MLAVGDMVSEIYRRMNLLRVRGYITSLIPPSTFSLGKKCIVRNRP